MSGYFTAQTATVDIDAHNTIVVRRLTWGEIEEIKSASTVMTVAVPMSKGKKQIDDGEIVIDPYKTKKEMTLRSVVSWEGPNFEQRPVNRDNILALPMWVIDRVAEVVDGLNEPMDEEAKKP